MPTSIPRRPPQLQGGLAPMAPRHASPSFFIAGAAVDPPRRAHLPEPPQRRAPPLHALRLRPRTAFTFLSADGWLKYESVDRPRTFFLVNPFSGVTIDIPSNGLGDLHCGNVWSHIVKMVVCSPELIAAVFIDGKVGFYRPGTPSWSTFPAHCMYRVYRAIAFYHGKLYTLAINDELFAHDPVGHGEAAVEHVIKAHHTPATDHEEYYNPSMTKRYLVASDDKLLMVTWSAPCSMGSANVEMKVCLREIFSCASGRR